MPVAGGLGRRLLVALVFPFLASDTDGEAAVSKKGIVVAKVILHCRKLHDLSIGVCL